MFTGLIQQVGRLAAVKNVKDGARLRINATWQPQLTPGESIAVNGVCLTAATITADAFECDILAETLRRTNLGGKRPGDQLNLERALRLGDPVGGHLVTGHVDGTGNVIESRAAGRDLILRITCACALLAGIVPKGSIAVDGVSLTVAELAPDAFSVHLIPFTRAETVTAQWQAGATVNLETDIIGKYVYRHLQSASGQSSTNLDLNTLRQAGF